MITFSEQTTEFVVWRSFSDRLALRLTAECPSHDVKADLLFETVLAYRREGQAAGFVSEADLALYCLAWYFDPHAMETKFKSEANRSSLALTTRRYSLKAMLDVNGYLPFGAHEAIPPETTSP